MNSIFHREYFLQSNEIAQEKLNSRVAYKIKIHKKLGNSKKWTHRNNEMRTKKEEKKNVKYEMVMESDS